MYSASIIRVKIGTLKIYIFYFHVLKAANLLHNITDAVWKIEIHFIYFNIHSNNFDFQVSTCNRVY